MLNSTSSTELRTTKQKILLYIMCLAYVGAGINHFRNPDFYVKMIPPFLPSPELLNYISGAAEIILGLLLVWKPARKLAAFGIILLLIAVYPANIYMAIDPEKFGVPLWAALVRLPLQFLMIAWAYYYARPLRDLLPGPSKNTAK